jgi:protection-of-telomeres protein 1
VRYANDSFVFPVVCLFECFLASCEVGTTEVWLALVRVSKGDVRASDSASTSATKARLRPASLRVNAKHSTTSLFTQDTATPPKPPMVSPPGFVDLATAQGAAKNSLVHVIGVVVDYLPPKQIYGGGDFLVTFKLQDQSMRYSGEGLKVRFFKKRSEDLPPIKAIGDVVLLRSVKVNEYQNEVLLISGFQTAHLVFSGPIVPSPAFKLDYVGGNGKLPCHGTDGLRNALGPVEQDYIITLKSELNIQIKAVDTPLAPPAAHGARQAQPAQSGVANRAAVPGAFSHKFKLVKDLQNFIFSDICVEVVKKFPTFSGGCELYVTDYTPNKQMFYYAPPEEKNDLVRDGDHFGYNGPPKREWPGPYGFLVFKVNLVDPHASFAIHQVSEGDMIALENVKVKLMPNNSRLEGDMWSDQHNHTKVQVRKLDRRRKEITDLLLRKNEYLTDRKVMLDKLGKAAEDAPQKLSRKARKRRSKLEAQKTAVAQLAAQHAAAVRYIPGSGSPYQFKKVD